MCCDFVPVRFRNPWVVLTICSLFMLSSALGVTSCSSKSDKEREALERYLSIRSVLTGTLDLPHRVEESLGVGFPQAREEILSLAEEGKKVIQSLRSYLREYGVHLEKTCLDPHRLELLRSQASLLEACADDLENYLVISANLAREFPFRRNPSFLIAALDQLDTAWDGLRESLRRLREGERQLRDVYERT